MTSATPTPTPTTAATAADGFNGLAPSAPNTQLHSTMLDPGRPTSALQPYRLVLLDIEGTTTDIAFVHDTLFPYARQHLAPLIRSHLASPPSATVSGNNHAQVQSAIDLLHTSGAISDPTCATQVIDHLHALMDSDTKSTPLKQLQGLLWDTAYKRGDIQAHVYSDLVPILYYYQAHNIPVAIYSSGSIHAQRLLFTYSQFGDLTPLLSGIYFDTTTGPKLVRDSYIKIVHDLKTRGLVDHPHDILFVSDNPNELVAARDAGVQVALADRPGNPLVTDEARREYPVMHVFSQLVWPQLHLAWAANGIDPKKPKRAHDKVQDEDSDTVAKKAKTMT